MAIVLRHRAHVHVPADTELGDQLGESFCVHEGGVRNEEEKVILFEVVVPEVLERVKRLKHLPLVSEAHDIS